MKNLTTHPNEELSNPRPGSAATGDAGSSNGAELRDWMTQYADGDTKAFAPLYSALHPAVFRYHLCSTRRPEVAEDLTQKTFLKLHVARQRYRKGAPVKPWVFTIAKNVQRDLFRRQKRSREDLLEAADSRWSQCATPAEPIDDPLMQNKLQEAIHSLPGGQRDVIVLHKFHGMSMAEVADELRIGLSAAKVRAHRGYAALRSFLNSEDEGIAPSARSTRWANSTRWAKPKAATARLAA